MTVVSITSGAHWRNVGLDTSPGDQFAHVWDTDEVEGREQQAKNFLTYLAALGGCAAPYVLIGPERDEWSEAEWAHIEVELSEWRQIVQSATGVEVEIQ